MIENESKSLWQGYSKEPQRLLTKPLARFIAGILSVVALSDYLQHVYMTAKELPGLPSSRRPTGPK